MSKVLFLASWYPSKVDFLNGDFVERHAEAIALKNDVNVIFVCKDPLLKKEKFNFEYKENGRLKVYKGYYKESESRFDFIRKIISQYRYFKCLHKLYIIQLPNQGKPDLVHLCIPLKAGPFALYLKFFKNLKYVISEHQSYYMPASGIYDKQNFLTQWLTKLIFKHASCIHTVSKALGKILTEKNIIKKNYVVIPNVVNTNIFYPSEIYTQDNHFVTITGNVFHKNTDGILRAFNRVLKKRTDFKLFVVGPYKNSLKEMAAEMGLASHTQFLGAVPYHEVANINRQCTAMIFFTRYETFGCVIIEANACGLPVIASDLEVVRANIEENINGIFITSEDEDGLSKKILWYMDHKNNFNRNGIASFAKKNFNYEEISKQFDEFYKNALN